MNKEVLRHLRMMVFAVNETYNWGHHLALIQRIINAQIHISTGVAPAQLLFGGQIDTNRHILIPPDPNITSVSSGTRDPRCLSSHYEELLKNQKRLVTLAQATLDKRDVNHINSKRL